MKKLLILCVSILTLVSCTNEDNDLTEQLSSIQNEVKTQPVQVDDSIASIKEDEIVVSNEVKNADLSILVLGDSLSAGYGITLEKSWVQLLENDLEKDGTKVAITNGSISGETTGGGLARLDDLLVLGEPDIVIVELGGNDGLRGYPVKSIRKNLETIIAKSRAAGAKVMLCGIMIPPNYGERYANAFAELYPKLSEDLNVPLVPFILDGVALNDEMMQDDGIHPNELGQPRIRANVFSIMKNLKK